MVREILRNSPYSVRIRENADQKNSAYRHFSRNAIFIYLFITSIQRVSIIIALFIR